MSCSPLFSKLTLQLTNSGRSDIAVINDAHLLGGALLTNHCQWGIAVIAGTGSVIIALEVDEHGRVQQIGRRGGAGYLLGDDGSGELVLVLMIKNQST